VRAVSPENESVSLCHQRKCNHDILKPTSWMHSMPRVRFLIICRDLTSRDLIARSSRPGWKGPAVCILFNTNSQTIDVTFRQDLESVLPSAAVVSDQSRKVICIGRSAQANWGMMCIHNIRFTTRVVCSFLILNNIPLSHLNATLIISAFSIIHLLG
jgi:hypothetical protein